METLEGLKVILEVPAGIAGWVQGSLVLLVDDASPEGWATLHEALGKAGISPDSHLTQLAWWGDGVELWVVEQP